MSLSSQKKTIVCVCGYACTLIECVYVCVRVCVCVCVCVCVYAHCACIFTCPKSIYSCLSQVSISVSNFVKMPSSCVMVYAAYG